MKRWVSLAAAATMTGCVSADGPVKQGRIGTDFVSGQCFRASDVSNYNVEAPHAVFVLTRRGYVYGLVAENCFRDDGVNVTLPRSHYADLWLCSGDTAELQVSSWRRRGHICRAQITAPIDDPDISGFKARARAG